VNYKTRQPFPHAAYVEGQRNFTYFDRSLTSGLTDVVIESPGDFLYIDQASTGVISVELNMRQGGTLAPILLAAGGSIECDFASVKLTASAQLNKTIRVIIGNGARIKGGANVNADSMSVSVVDGGLARTVERSAFMGTAPASAVAAQYAQTQLWNPAASGKNLFLTSVSCSSTTASTIQFADYSAALATGSPAYMNKYLNSSVGVGNPRYTTSATFFVVNTGPSYSIAANSVLKIDFSEPVMIPQGRGFNVFSGTANANLISNFEWHEK